MLIKILNVKPILHFRDKHYLMHYQCIIFFVYFWIWHASILIWSISSFDGNLLQYSWLVIPLFASNFCSLPLCYLNVEYCILIDPSIYHTIMLKLYQVDIYHTLFSPRIPLKFHMVFIHHAFLTVTVSLTLFLMTLIVLRITSQIFVKKKRKKRKISQ